MNNVSNMIWMVFSEQHLRQKNDFSSQTVNLPFLCINIQTVHIYWVYIVNCYDISKLLLVSCHNVDVIVSQGLRTTSRILVDTDNHQYVPKDNFRVNPFRIFSTISKRLERFSTRKRRNFYFYGKGHHVKHIGLQLELQLLILNEENGVKPDFMITISDHRLPLRVFCLWDRLTALHQYKFGLNLFKISFISVFM